jgi:DNA-binding beta-propeller fold protein YncE
MAPHSAFLLAAIKGSHSLGIMDPASGRTLATVDVHGVTGHEVIASPGVRWLAVAMPRVNQVAVVDLRSRSVAHLIDVPPTPQMALLRPDGAMLYVSCGRSGQIAAIRTSDWKLDKLIPAGPLAGGLA